MRVRTKLIYIYSCMLIYIVLIAAQYKKSTHPKSVQDSVTSILFQKSLYHKQRRNIYKLTLSNNYLQMNKPKTSRMHTLALTYAEYVKCGKSIANSKIQNYLVYDELGRGSFGAVYRGMNDQTKRTVAIKVLDLDAVEKDPNERVKQIRRRLCESQSKLMMLCNSENVIKCYDVYENRSLKIIVMEYCNGGDLQHQISNKGRIPENEAILILKQLINGIAELHTHNIIHRDLKAENILSHNGVYKIADLGFSKQVDEQEVKRTTLGTITTMAPEVMKKQTYGLKADIWSLGIIFFQMIFGKVPYTSTNAILMWNEIQTKKILNTEQFEFKGYKASKEVTKFLREVICIDKKKRLGWKDLINHEIFQLNNNRLDNEFRINCQLKKPEVKIDDAVENEQLTQSFNMPHFLPLPNQDKSEHTIVRLTQKEASQKMKELIKDEDQLFSWIKETHLECLKTEMIYHQIYEVIESHKLLDLQERNVIQLLYLILTRCLNNISVINDKIKHQQHVQILTDLQQKNKSLYSKITKAWKNYSLKLTKIQDSVTSIIGDRFLKIFKSESIRIKDKFLTGIETIEYTKQQQIEFTYQEYIKQLKAELRPSQSSKKLKSYLSHYAQINAIRLGDLKQRDFKEYVQMILQ